MGLTAAETQRRKPMAMMLDHLPGPPVKKTLPASPALAGARERAAAAVVVSPWRVQFCL
jgi:hypothetical protein